MMLVERMSAQDRRSGRASQPALDSIALTRAESSQNTIGPQLTVVVS